MSSNPQGERVNERIKLGNIEKPLGLPFYTAGTQ